MKLFFLLVLIPFSAMAQEIKVLTWNTTRQKERVDRMIEKLPEMSHDMMFFQETFFDKKRKLIIQALKKTHPYVAVPKKGIKIGQIQDSGLFIASKFPLEILGQVIFKGCAHNDCSAPKSAILIAASLSQDKKVQVINPHLQAWNDSKAVLVRQKQSLVLNF